MNASNGIQRIINLTRLDKNGRLKDFGLSEYETEYLLNICASGIQVAGDHIDREIESCDASAISSIAKYFLFENFVGHQNNKKLDEAKFACTLLIDESVNQAIEEFEEIYE